MIGKGANMRHPIYIKDMLEAFKLSMEEAQAIGETLLIGGEEIVTTRELVNVFSEVLDIPGPVVSLSYPVGFMLAGISETLFGLIGKEPPVSKRTLEFFNTNNAFDISKAKRILHFKPRYSVADGLRDAKEWFNSL